MLFLKLSLQHVKVNLFIHNNYYNLHTKEKSMMMLFSDMILVKNFCEDILKTLDMLEAGNCSLKGFLCHKLYRIRGKFKNSSMPNGFTEVVA